MEPQFTASYNGFFTALVNSTGVGEEWINFNGQQQDVVYCTNPGSGMCNPTTGIRDWYGWPQKKDHIDVANPEDVVTKTMGNLDEFRDKLWATTWEMLLGAWEGPVDGVLQVVSVPIFMLAEAVQGMKDAKEMGEEEEKWEEEEARPKAKNLILTILGMLGMMFGLGGIAGAARTSKGFQDVGVTRAGLRDNGLIGKMA